MQTQLTELATQHVAPLHAQVQELSTGQLAQLKAQVAELASTQQQLAHPLSVAPAPVAMACHMANIPVSPLGQAKLNKPEYFLGTGTPTVDEWLFRMGEYLEATGVPPDASQVRIAASYLHGNAEVFWRAL